MDLLNILAAEIVLVVAACALFLSGFFKGRVGGQLAAVISLGAILAALTICVLQYVNLPSDPSSFARDTFGNFRITAFSCFMRVIALAVAALLVMVNFPSNADGSGSRTVDWGRDGPEYFGLMLLSFAGLIMTPQANDLIVLFMALELASIPTYILVAIGRPLPAAQEAGVKYFFLGALAAALVLMGFAYLYGATGTTNITQIATHFANEAKGADGAPILTAWELLAGVLVIIAVGFKLAAVPMHAYAADVYQGAATPVTAILGFVPKTVGVVIQIKLLLALGGGTFNVPETLERLLWVMAVLTMTFGNLLGLTQNNVKRVLAYSSVSHSGYLLAGLTVMAMGGVGTASGIGIEGLKAVIFYIAIYGFTSTASFGVLSLIPTRQTINVDGKKYRLPASGAESFDDIAGVGRDHPILGAAMAIACFGLIGLPLTAGFVGKYLLIEPALANSGDAENGTWLLWLAIFMIINSATGAAYYLRIVYTLFAKPVAIPGAPEGQVDDPFDAQSAPMFARVAVGLCVAVVAAVGFVLPVTSLLATNSETAAQSLEVRTITVTASAETK
jgi:NADH-quinone oxidoreductase subunit N